MRRPRWTYRPLLCLLGLHATTKRRAAGTIKVGDMYHMGYRLITDCQRLTCPYVREIVPVTVVINARNSVERLTGGGYICGQERGHAPVAQASGTPPIP